MSWPALPTSAASALTAGGSSPARTRTQTQLHPDTRRSQSHCMTHNHIALQSCTWVAHMNAPAGILLHARYGHNADTGQHRHGVRCRANRACVRSASAATLHATAYPLGRRAAASLAGSVAQPAGPSAGSSTLQGGTDAHQHRTAPTRRFDGASRHGRIVPSLLMGTATVCHL